MKSRNIVVLILALVFGLSAAVGVNLYLRHSGESRVVDLGEVVVTTADIPRGITVTPAHLKVREWPRDHVPPGALKRVEDAQGRVASGAMVKGEVVLENKLSSKDAGRGLAAMVPAGMRAFTIHMPQIASGVAGFVLPGNKVDVLLTMSTSDSSSGGAVTLTLLQNLEILAVDQRLNPPSENKVDYRMLQSVTLLVTPDQASRLDLAQSRGTLHLALRNPEDTSPANARPATLTDLLAHTERPDATAGRVPEKQPETVKGPETVPPPPPVVEEPVWLQIRTLRNTSSGVVILEQQPVRRIP